MSTQSLQRQHLELMTLAQEIRALLVPEILEADPRRVRILVARFAGKLRVHDRMETEALYPALMADSREEVRTAASRLHGELGAVYAVFDGYERRYPDAASLLVDPRRFVTDTLEVFEVLGRRMRRENRELYALLAA